MAGPSEPPNVSPDLLFACCRGKGGGELQHVMLAHGTEAPRGHGEDQGQGAQVAMEGDRAVSMDPQPPGYILEGRGSPAPASPEGDGQEALMLL